MSARTASSCQMADSRSSAQTVAAALLVYDRKARHWDLAAFAARGTACPWSPKKLAEVGVLSDTGVGILRRRGWQVPDHSSWGNRRPSIADFDESLMLTGPLRPALGFRVEAYSAQGQCHG